MNRIKELINELNISQTEFAASIGMTKSNVSKLVKGSINLTDSNIKLLCIQYDINEQWLRTGEGEMFDTSNENDIDYLVGRYGDDLPANVKDLIITLLRMSPEKRQAFDEFLQEYDKMRGK